MNKPKVAIVFHGDRAARETVRLEDHRLGPTAAALEAEDLEPEPAVYNDDFRDEVQEQLLGVDAALVWVNPIEQENDRAKLDETLTHVAAHGVFVSAHPKTIQKMGTKDVLFRTRNMSWGSDVHVYMTIQELREQLPLRISEGRPRVLKQLRGHSGHGIWKVSPHAQGSNLLTIRHALRGSVERTVSTEDFLETCEPYFARSGHMLDQAYQERLTDGMVRCYLVQDKVCGFGHQMVNALFPAGKGLLPTEAPQPGPRLYYPPDHPEFQRVRTQMEREWLPAMMDTLTMDLADLPLLWDADFLFGPKNLDGEDTHVLCEINVSSVYPYPQEATYPLARALRKRLTQAT